jgi:hypothetical protein
MKNSPTRAGELSPTWALAPLRDANEKWWSDWDRLNEQSLDSHPLLTSVIARALCEHFAPADACIATLGGEGVSVAQLILVKAGRLKWSVFTPSQAPVSLVVFDRTWSRSCPSLDGLVPVLPWATLAIEFPVQDPLCSPLQGSLPLLHKVPWGTTVGVNLASTFDVYWESRSKELKHNMRRYMKRIGEEYGENWRLARCATPEHIGSAVDRYGLLESRGWKGREGTALAPDNPQGKFYRRLLQDLAQKGQAAVFELYFGETLAAARLTVSGQSMHVILKTTYDETLSRFAPGRVHLHLMLQQMFLEPTKRSVEFYTRANKDTISWSTDQRQIESATLYRNSLVAGLAATKTRFRIAEKIARLRKQESTPSEAANP